MIQQAALTLALVAAILLLDLLVSSAAVRYIQTNAATLVLAQIVAQIGLASAWIGIGPQAILLRTPSALVVVAAAFWQLGVWNSRAADDFGLAVLVEAAVILSGLTALQLAGYRLSAGASRPAAGEIDSPIPQFTILQLMLATAVVAAMVAGLVHVSAVPLGSRANDGFSLVVGAYFAGVTLASLLAALLFQHAAVPVAAVVVASAALGLAVALAMRDEGLIGPAMLLMGATAMVETAAFGLLRRRGYRLQRKRGPIAIDW